MEASQVVRDAIEARMTEYLAATDPRLGWLREASRKYSFLPLYVGWVATLGIRPDGSLVRWDHEDAPDHVKMLSDPFLIRMALYQGAKSYPELAALIPERPVHARDCGTCLGTGQIATAPQIICKCGGLGWSIPGAQMEASPG